MPKLIDLSGQRFGRLVVEVRTGSTNGHPLWLCVCDCGEITQADTSQLRSGNTKSCGCLRKDVSRAACTKHGLYGSKAHAVWRAMMQRCYDKNQWHWKYYGGRGIKVCKRWHKFENFYEDMGDPPLGLTLDRKNNDNGYSKRNCRWSSRKEQANNRRRPNRANEGRR